MQNKVVVSVLREKTSSLKQLPSSVYKGSCVLFLIKLVFSVRSTIALGEFPSRKSSSVGAVHSCVNSQIEFSCLPLSAP